MVEIGWALASLETINSAAAIDFMTINCFFQWLVIASLRGAIAQ